MEDLILLDKKMERLRLGGMRSTCAQRVKTAQSEKWSYSAFLDTLLTDEVERRNHSQLTRRLAKSQLKPNKTLETFEFDFNSGIHAATIRELACCKFIEEGQNIFIMGPAGVGKSHLAQALGHEACRRGYDVLCYRTHKLFEWINSGRGDGTHTRKMNQVIRIPLLILDDFGLQSMTETGQEDLYELILARYEQKPLIITSNRDLSEWTTIFTSPLVASAAVDRLVHKAIDIRIEGESYRLDQYRKRTKIANKEETKEKLKK
jgi:DNA replication protein DnaC